MQDAHWPRSICQPHHAQCKGPAGEPKERQETHCGETCALVYLVMMVKCRSRSNTKSNSRGITSGKFPENYQDQEKENGGKDNHLCWSGLGESSWRRPPPWQPRHGQVPPAARRGAGKQDHRQGRATEGCHGKARVQEYYTTLTVHLRPRLCCTVLEYFTVLYCTMKKLNTYILKN